MTDDDETMNRPTYTPGCICVVLRVHMVRHGCDTCDDDAVVRMMTVENMIVTSVELAHIHTYTRTHTHGRTDTVLMMKSDEWCGVHFATPPTPAPAETCKFD